MISISPLTEVALGHRALHLAVGKSGHIVAISKEGAGSLLAPDCLKTMCFDLECHVKGVSISPSGDLLAVLDEDALSLIHLPDFVENHRLDGMFESCLFSPSGRLLWTAKRVSGEVAAIEIFETEKWQTVGNSEVADPFGDSGLMLFAQPNDAGVTLWVAAGQDGQSLYWARYADSKVTVEPFPKLMDTTPPAFDQAGRRFLVVSGGTVCLFQYPGGPELGRIAWPLEDDPPAEMIAFLGNQHALAHSGNGRLFLLDLNRLAIVEEMQIRGHEPRPVKDLFPNLPRDLQPCTDLSTFIPLPSGTFLSLHHALPSKSIADWRDQLITWRVPQ